MEYDVFISYSRKDTEIVDYIEAELRKRGIVCFVDRSDIELGDDFAEVISKAIFESEILLFVWSENSNQSPNTANEIALAIDFEKTIISFKIGKFKPDYRLAYRLVRFNRIDALTYNRQQIIELADKVARRLGKGVQPSAGTSGGNVSSPVSEENNLLQDDFDPEQEMSYKEGIRALTQFKLQKAFGLLYPLALAGYRQAPMYLARITRGKTRMHKLDEQQIAVVKADANNGIPLAQYVMGCYYYQTGDAAQSFGMLKQAADSGLTLAYGTLANFYDIGFGTPMDHGKYLEYIQKGIRAGDIESRLIHARNYRNGWTLERDLEKAEHMLLELEKEEDPRSIEELGYLYKEEKHDADKAIAYFEKAIAMGQMESHIGLAYTCGLSAPDTVIDGKRYIEELMKGAEYGEVSCLANLAVAYYDGIGVRRNYKQALRWAEKAAQSGDTESYWLVGYIYYYGNDEIPADEPKAWTYFMKGKQRINSLCSFYLGKMCQEGYAQDGYTQQDCIPFYEEAVSLGGAFHEAAIKLYHIYSEGELAEKDMDKALYYLKKAADDNSAEACTLYGKLLTDLNSKYCNEFKGVKYLKTAAEASDYEAIYRLGELYRQGIGVPVDMEQSIACFRRAADEGNYGPAQVALGHILSHASTNLFYDVERTDSLSPEQIKAEQKEAIAYGEKAIECGYDSGYDIISNTYWDMSNRGDYEDEDINRKWFEWQSKAYGHYFNDAYLLAMLYQYGLGTPPDLEKSIQLYEEDYRKGNSRATTVLADLYMDMNATGEARAWLQKGVDMGDQDAIDKLKQLDAN